MAADDERKGSARGFSGLSTLVSDVEDGTLASKSEPQEASPPSPAPTPEPAPRQAEEARPASTTPTLSKSKGEGSSDVTTGKWMVGIGLGIGLLLIVLVNSIKNEPAYSTVAPPIHASATPVPIYSPPTVVPSTQSRQLPQERVTQQRSATELVSILGQQVVFSNPTGYCTPGKSAREVDLVDLAARSLGEGSRLVHAAVRCSELEDYRQERRDTLDHWLQIQLIGPKGKFQRLEMQREAFLSGLSNSSSKTNSEEISRRLRASLANSDLNLSQMQVEPIGRDGNAVYFSMRMNMSAGGSSRLITGISAITLLNALPLSINVYEATGSSASRSQLQKVQQELLNSLLTEN